MTQQPPGAGYPPTGVPPTPWGTPPPAPPSPPGAERVVEIGTGNGRRVVGIVLAVIGGIELLTSVAATVQAITDYQTGAAVGVGFLWLVGIGLAYVAWRLLRPRVPARFVYGPAGVTYVPAPRAVKRAHPGRRKVAGFILLALAVAASVASVHLTILVFTNRTDPSNGRGLGLAWGTSITLLCWAWVRLRPRVWRSVPAEVVEPTQWTPAPPSTPDVV